MSFEVPWYASLILTLPVCLLLYNYARRRKRAAMDQLVGSGMKTVVDQASSGRAGYRLLPHWLLAAVITSFVLALDAADLGQARRGDAADGSGHRRAVGYVP